MEVFITDSLTDKLRYNFRQRKRFKMTGGRLCTPQRVARRLFEDRLSSVVEERAQTVFDFDFIV